MVEINDNDFISQDEGESYNLMDLLQKYTGGGKDSDSEDEPQEEEEVEAEVAAETFGDDDLDLDLETNVTEDGEKRMPVWSKTDGTSRSNRSYKTTVLTCGVCLESDENEVIIHFITNL